MVTVSIFLSEQHPASRRWAVLEDDGLSAWLYLTEPGSEKPVADCWIYNRIPDPEPAASYLSRGVAPPAPAEYVSSGALLAPPDAARFRLVWSQDGKSVAVFAGSILMSFIASGHRRGVSRNLKRAGAWGNPLDESVYKSAFAPER
jgi:hypothetical protein